MTDKIPHICEGMTVDKVDQKHVMAAHTTVRAVYGDFMANTISVLNPIEFLIYAASIDPDYGFKLERCNEENLTNLDGHTNLKVANWVFVDAAWLKQVNLSIIDFHRQLNNVNHLKVGVINVEAYGDPLSNMKNMGINNVYSKIVAAVPHLDHSIYDVVFIWGVRFNICTAELFLAERIVNIKPPM